MTDRPSARQRVSMLSRSFDEQDIGLRGDDPLRFPGYAEQLAHARDETGLDEACVWGWADIQDRRCALVVFDFAFMGGSMGIVVGEKVARAFDAARRTNRAVVTVTASGGARMQEGMWSLVQMAKTVEARRAHAAAALPHVSLLTSPTTGGVYASFASLADVIYAEPDATVGFAGPRVVEELTGTRPASDVHTAEFAFEHGLVDAVVARDEQRSAIARAVAALTTQRRTREPLDASDAEPEAPDADIDAWQRLQLVRDDARAKGVVVADVLLHDAVELRGDRTGAPDDEHVVVRAGGLRGTTLNAIVIAQDAIGDGRIRPEGFRKAVRAIELGGRLGLPVITVVDTRGADPLPASEGGGVAVAIARTFDALLGCPTPTVCVVLGEGGSGGALAMAPTDTVVALGNAVFSVIAPEGAAAILYRDPDRAPDLAREMRITVPDLVDLGLVDAVIPEPPPGVPLDRQVLTKRLTPVIAGELERLTSVGSRRRMTLRRRRWRAIAPAAGRRPGPSSGGRRAPLA